MSIAFWMETRDCHTVVSDPLTQTNEIPLETPRVLSLVRETIWNVPGALKLLGMETLTVVQDLGVRCTVRAVRFIAVEL